MAVWVVSGLFKKELGLSSYSEIYTARYLRAQSPSNVDIAVVYADGEDEMYLGVDMAFANRSVTVRGKKIQVTLHPFRTGNNSIAVKDQIALARKIARDESYVAILGHSTSDIASVASVSYEYTKLLYFAVTATDPALTEHGFAYTFRTPDTDEEYAREVAFICGKLHVKRVGTFYEQSIHAESAIDSLEGALDDQSVSTVFERPYEILLGSSLGSVFERRQRQARLQDQIASVEHLPENDRPEIIAVVGDSVLSALQLWKQLSVSGLGDLPIVLFGTPLDANAFIGNTGRRPGKDGQVSLPVILDPKNPADWEREPRAIYLPAMFSTAEADEDVSTVDVAQRAGALKRIAELQQFNSAYKERFKKQPAALRYPEALALRGYATGEVLRQAMERSQSLAPVDVQETLKANQNKFETLGRLFSFDTKGDRTIERLGAPGEPELFKKFSPESVNK